MDLFLLNVFLITILYFKMLLKDVLLEMDISQEVDVEISSMSVPEIWLQHFVNFPFYIDHHISEI